MQLIYRAQTIEYPLRPDPPSFCKPCGLNSPVQEGSVKLIYRGQAFEYTPRLTQPYRKPRAMNWRWQMTMSAS